MTDINKIQKGLLSQINHSSSSILLRNKFLAQQSQQQSSAPHETKKQQQPSTRTKTSKQELTGQQPVVDAFQTIPRQSLSKENVKPVTSKPDKSKHEIQQNITRPITPLLQSTLEPDGTQSKTAQIQKANQRLYYSRLKTPTSRPDSSPQPSYTSLFHKTSTTQDQDSNSNQINVAIHNEKKISTQAHNTLHSTANISSTNTLCNIGSTNTTIFNLRHAASSDEHEDIEEQCEKALNAIQAKEIGINLLSRLELIQQNYKKYAESYLHLQKAKKVIKSLEESLKNIQQERDFALELVFGIAKVVQMPNLDRQALINEIRSQISQITLTIQETCLLNSLKAQPDLKQYQTYTRHVQTDIVAEAVQPTYQSFFDMGKLSPKHSTPIISAVEYSIQGFDHSKKSNFSSQPLSNCNSQEQEQRCTLILTTNPLQHGDTFSSYDIVTQKQLNQLMIEKTGVLDQKLHLEQSGDQLVDLKVDEAQSLKQTQVIEEDCNYPECKIEIAIAQKTFTSNEIQMLSFRKGEKILIDRSVQSQKQQNGQELIFGRIGQREGFFPDSGLFVKIEEYII